MFDKQNPSNAQASDEIFHTMQDDLGNSPRKISPKTAFENTPQKQSASLTPQESNGAQSSTNPFLAEIPFEQKNSQIESVPKNLGIEISEEIPNKELYLEKESFAPKKINWVKLAIISLVIIILSVIFFSIYFFWNSKQTNLKQTAQSTIEETIPEPNENPVTISPELENYSLENPNVISIDIESTTDQELTELLSKKAAEISSLQITNPIEFVITDKNNNPISFPIFALTAKINLSQELLQNLEEKFSLYMFPDNNATKIGLAIDVKNKDIVLTKMLGEEKNLPSALSFLFLDTKPTITKEVLFKDNTFNNFSIRYFNLEENTNSSIDYTITDKQILIGTSKNTLRAIVEKNQTN